MEVEIGCIPILFHMAHNWIYTFDLKLGHIFLLLVLVLGSKVVKVDLGVEAVVVAEWDLVVDLKIIIKFDQPRPFIFETKMNSLNYYILEKLFTYLVEVDPERHEE